MGSGSMEGAGTGAGGAGGGAAGLLDMPPISSSSSPKRESKLLVLSAGLPGASSSSPLLAPLTPFVPPSLLRPPDMPFVSVSLLISCQLSENGRNAMPETCPALLRKSLLVCPVLRSQSYTFLSQEPDRRDFSSEARVRTLTAEVCLRRVVIILPSSWRTDWRFIPPL